MIYEVTLWCPLMLQLLVFCLWVPKGRAFYVQHWLVKEYAMLVGNHLQILVGQLHREGGGGLGLLKLPLQVLKKRRVLRMRAVDHFLINRPRLSPTMNVHVRTQTYLLIRTRVQSVQ